MHREECGNEKAKKKNDNNTLYIMNVEHKKSYSTQNIIIHYRVNQ